MDKVTTDTDAVRDIADGATLLVGGFGLCGIPSTLIDALHVRGPRGLTVVGNNCGTTTEGLGVLLAAGQIRRVVASFTGGNATFERLYLAGELEWEVVPQGTLAERLRAAGAGIPAFYTPTAAGTDLAAGKEVRDFDGRPHFLEHAIRGDFALVRAWRGDRWGNLVYRRTARNFNPLVAMAGRVTIAEVEELVEPGELDPDQIHTPGVFVQRVIVAEPGKLIEQRTVR